MASTDPIMADCIGIAGTGNLAKALAGALELRGVAVHVASARGEALRCLPQHARHILIAVSDSAIQEVAENLAACGFSGGVVLHTSGAMGPGALQPLQSAGNAIGVLHPLQTVPSPERGIQTLPGSTYAVAGDPAAVEWASLLISQLDGKPLHVNPAFWQHYHAGAVMACNYQMTLVDAAIELMSMAGVARSDALDALGPILRATTENILAVGPERALTGPIRRGDADTIDRHLAAIEDAMPQTRDLYVTAGLRTIDLARRAGLEEASARRIAEMFGGI